MSKTAKSKGLKKFVIIFSGFGVKVHAINFALTQIPYKVRFWFMSLFSIGVFSLLLFMIRRTAGEGGG